MAKENIVNSNDAFIANSINNAPFSGSGGLLFEICRGSVNTSHYFEICNQAALGTTTTGLMGVKMKSVNFVGIMPEVIGGGGFTTTTSIMWNVKIINKATTLARVFVHSNSLDTSGLAYFRALVVGSAGI